MKQKTKKAIMLSTYARGGIRSVVEGYQNDGLLEKWNFHIFWTHKEGSKFDKTTTFLTAYFKLLKLLIMGEVSIIHAHAAMRGSFWRKSVFNFTARLFKVPCILHLHGSEMKTFYNSLSRVGKCMVRWSLEHAEVVIVLSESWRSFVEQVAPKANIFIINNYVKLPEQLPPKVNSGKYDVLFLGVLGQRKGIYDLLECWPKILKELPGARLLVGGNGEVEKAKKLVETLNIGASVLFLGWISGDQKEKLLQESDVFVLPSYNEGLPMSILEAMSWGKAVVATKVGGIPELITHDVDGLLFTPGDQTKLCNLLILLGNNFEKRVSIGDLGQMRVKNVFSDAVVLPKLENIYNLLQNKLKH